MKIEDVEIYKFYEDCTKEELEILPKIAEEIIQKNIEKYGFNPVQWNGKKWIIASEAFY